MSSSDLSTPNPSATSSQTPTEPQGDPRYMAKPSDSYTKLAMKNMVRRKGTSLFHFTLTTLGVLALLIGLAVAFH